jgi:hypothetical protein
MTEPGPAPPTRGSPCCYPGPRGVDFGAAVLSVGRHGRCRARHPGVAGGWRVVGLLIAVGVSALVLLAFWLRRRRRQGKPTLIDPDLFQSDMFKIGITQQMLQQIALGGTMIVLPIYLQMVL